MRTLLSLAVTVLVAAASAGRAAADDPPKWKWYETEGDGTVRVNLHLFWAEGCPHCAKGLDFAKDLQARKPWVKVYTYEVTRNAGNLALYKAMADDLKKNAGITPAFFYCKQLQLGYASYEQTGAWIEKGLDQWYEALKKPRPPKAAADPARELVRLLVTLQPGDVPVPDPDFDLELPPPPEPPPADTVYVPGQGQVEASALSLPLLTLILGGCDAFNPCAFFVLLTLLGIMTHSRSRAHLLLVGGVFVFFSGLLYFLFMAAWLNVFLLVGQLQAITVAAGVMAAAAAVLNIKDFFAFKAGPTLSIPAAARPRLIRRMNGLLGATRWPAVLLGTAGLAFATNLYELLCTAGFPMVYTRVLTLRGLTPAEYYLWLAAYNLVYVAPLALIVAGCAWALGARKLSEYEGRVLKLLSGMMLLALAVVLLARPDLLQSAAGAAGVLGAAVVGTAAVVLVHRCVTGPRAGGPACRAAATGPAA